MAKETREEKGITINKKILNKGESSIKAVKKEFDYRLIKNYKTFEFINKLWEILSSKYEAKKHAAIDLGLGNYFFSDIKKNIYKNVIENKRDYVITPLYLDTIEFNCAYINLIKC